MKYVATLIAVLIPTVGIADANVGDLYPLHVGYRWTHKVIESSQGNTKATVQVTRNLEEVDVFGHSHTPQLLEDGELPKYITYVRADGSGVFSSGSAIGDESPTERAERRYFIKSPAEIGTTWSFQSHTFLLSANYPVEIEATVRETGISVSAAAGNYDNCIEVSYANRPSPGTSHISIDWVDFYCTGVGFVTSRYAEISSDESGVLTMELVSLTKPSTRTETEIESDMADIESVWNSFRAALLANDVQLAGEHFAPYSRERYVELLKKMGSLMPTVPDNWSEFTPIRIGSELAVYGFIQKETRGDRLHTVTFVRYPGIGWLIQSY